MLSPVRRLSKSGSAGGALVQLELLNKGETSPVLLINPVFTITANNWAAACDAAATRRCYPKVRQKSKSSGASPQRHISPGNLGFGEEFINIVTSSESVDVEFGDHEQSVYEDYGSHPSSSHSHSRPSSYHSNPYLNASGAYESRYYYYGSNPKLLQVPSSSTLLLPQTREGHEQAGRQVRSSSITVPCSHHHQASQNNHNYNYYNYNNYDDAIYSTHNPRAVARCSSEMFIRRRCSSTSPNKASANISGGATTANYFPQSQPHPPPQPPPRRLSSSTHTSPRGRGFSLTPATTPNFGNFANFGTGGAFASAATNLPRVPSLKRRASYSNPRRRRSSTTPHTRANPIPPSSSSSSLSSQGKGGGGATISPGRRKGFLQRQQGLHHGHNSRDNSHRHELPPRQRTLSMPTCTQGGLGPEVVRDLVTLAATATTTKKPPSLKKMRVKDKSLSLSKKSAGISYDTVIIGSPNVGKSTLAEYFNKGSGSSSGGGPGSSGSDQGIGSGEEEDMEEEEEVEEDSYDDQDLLGGGKAILYRPQHHLELNQPTPHSTSAPQFNFTLRIFCQQISAVNHLYKYDAVLILYSVTDPDSFEFARKALEEILPCPQQPLQHQQPRDRKSSTPPFLPSIAKKVVILVGNKSDLERSRCVSSLEGRSLATAYDVKFIEVSSTLGVGIMQLQKGLATQVLLRHGATAGNSNGSGVGLPLPSMMALPLPISAARNKSGRHGSTSSSSTSSSSNSSSGFLISKKSSGLRGGPLSSLKLAQKLIDRIMALRIVGGHKTKSCLDLHSL